MYNFSLLKDLQQTKIFNEKMKFQFINNFEILTNKQKEILQELINLEKKILLGYLKNLKNMQNLTIWNIKYEYLVLLKKNIKIMELYEKDNMEVEDLLKALDNF